MKTLILLSVALLMGCSTSHYSKQAPDGTKVSMFNSRFVWSTEGFEAESIDKDVRTKVKIAKSNPDAVTAAAVTEAAVTAAMKSAVPVAPKLPAK